MLYYNNMDLENIETPINAEILKQLLIESNYAVEEIDYIFNGFTKGFSLEYQASTEVKQSAPNLKLRVGSKLELWNKMMAQVKDKRFAGPFKEIPFQYFIQSPVGLVQKIMGRRPDLFSIYLILEMARGCQ